jgi:hypothetical protein
LKLAAEKRTVYPALHLESFWPESRGAACYV